MLSCFWKRYVVVMSDLERESEEVPFPIMALPAGVEGIVLTVQANIDALLFHQSFPVPFSIDLLFFASSFRHASSAMW